MNTKDLVHTLTEGVVIEPGMTLKHKTKRVGGTLDRSTYPPRIVPGSDKPYTITVSSCSTRFVMTGRSAYGRRGMTRTALSAVLKDFTTMDGQPLLPPPEKEVKVPPNPAGTCPMCFNIQQTRRNEMVDHGYTVPHWGDGGNRQGSCPGVGWPSFEVSPEGTKKYLKDVLNSIAAFERMVEDVKDGKTPVPDPYDHSFKKDRFGRLLKRMLVPTGPAPGEAEDPYWAQKPEAERRDHYKRAWEEGVRHKVSELEFRIKSAEGTAEFLKGKLNGWKPAPLLHPVTNAKLPFVYDESLVDKMLDDRLQ